MLARLEAIGPFATRRWGKMEVDQMLAHTSNALEMAMGLRATKRVLIGRLIGGMIRKSYYDDSVFATGKPTSPELVASGSYDFHTQKSRLKELITKFAASGEAGITTAPHPFFGHLEKPQWAIGMYKHLDHHFRQFGA